MFQTPVVSMLQKKESCRLNSFIYNKYNTYITKCNKINDHAFCYVFALTLLIKTLKLANVESLHKALFFLTQFN